MVNAADPFIPTPVYKLSGDAVKAARPDIIITDDQNSVETMTSYIFDEIGGQELLSASRHDLISSPLASPYSLIADSGVNFNEERSIVFSEPSRAIVNAYPINLNDHIPFSGLNARFDDASGALSLDIANLGENYFIEVQFLSTTDALGGTIYEGDLLMFTTKGKTIVGKFLLEQTPAFASYIAVGCGAAPEGPTVAKTLTSGNIKSYELASNTTAGTNVVTVTTNTAHGFLTGEIYDFDFGDQRFDANDKAITVINTTAFSFTGTWGLPGITNAAWNANLTTYTTTSPHGLTVGDIISTVDFTAPTQIANSKVPVETVPSSTTFTLFEAASPGTITDKAGWITLHNPTVISDNIVITQVITDRTLAFQDQKALEFEMFRKPIISKNIVEVLGQQYLSFSAELPTLGRYGITEIGIYPDERNTLSGVPDSSKMFSFSDAENWERHYATTVAGETNSVKIDAISGAVTASSISGGYASYLNASSSAFDDSWREKRQQRPRFEDKFLLIGGNLSNVTYDSANAIYTISTEGPDSARIGDGLDHIHLANTRFNFDDNSSDDEIRLAFSLVPVTNNPVTIPAIVNIIVEFSSATTDDDTGQSAKFQVSAYPTATNSWYFVAKKKLSELVKTADFVWSSVRSTKIYVSVKDSTSLTASPSSSYSVALDGMRFENITSVSENPIYGLVAYSPLRTTTVYSGETISVPILKETNTNNMIEFNVGTSIVGA